MRPEELLDEASAHLRTALGDLLLTLAVHGSWVAGDFEPDRSDLDLVAVLARDPDDATLARLAEVHRRLAQAHPAWADRVEVDYVSRQAVADVVADRPATHVMARISPGEPIHLTPASRHYLLNWHSALRHDHVLAGLPVHRVVPPIPAEVVERVVVEHLEQWPAWVPGMRSTGAQAYSVLTVCRGAATLAAGADLSKRAAAAQGIRSMPDHEPLIAWARDWWYAGGSDADPGRYCEVVAFVRTVVPAIVRDHRGGAEAEGADRSRA